MKTFVMLALLALSVPSVVSAEESQGGVQKVISLLLDMSAKAKEEKKAEEVAFAKFSTWCKMESVNLEKSIKKQAEEMELLSASITKSESDATTLADEIGELQSDVVQAESDLKVQKKQRAKDHEAHLAELADYQESVTATEQAIVAEQAKAHATSSSFVQTGDAKTILLQIVQQNRIPPEAKSMVGAFLAMYMGEGTSDQAPEAHGYEFQSTALIDMLKKLQADFVDKKGQCEKEEINSEYAFNMVVADLTDTIENSEKSVESKTALKEHKISTAASNKKELAATTASKAEDESTLSDMDTECKQKVMSFDEKNQLRAEEIEAIAKAVEILSSESALAMVQTNAKATSLVQYGVRGTAMARSQGNPHRVYTFLTDEASRLNSKGLSLLAQKVVMANPFGKVKKLIDDMITRLIEEANEDATHEGYCDKEMGESKITRNKLNEEIDALQAAIEDGKATIMTLTQEIADLEKEMSDLAAAMTEATTMRTEEKTKNAETIKDSQAAQNAVTAATAVLKDFYTKAAQATGFVQTAAHESNPRMGTDEWKSLANPNFKGTVDKGHKAGMQTFGATYKGQQDSAGGILAMLEVILSDFANLEADTESGEATAQTAYEGFMTESKKNSRMKSKKSDLNTADRTAAETKLREDIADLKATQDELLAAERYYDKLVPQCIDKGMTYEERTAAREAEMASLKQALEIFSSEDISTSA